MYVPAFLLAAVLVDALLWRLNVLLGLAFLLLAMVAVPAIVIQRREVGLEPVPDSESERMHHGVFRLLAMLGLDLGGIALGVLLLIAVVLAGYFWFGGHSHAPTFVPGRRGG